MLLRALHVFSRPGCRLPLPCEGSARAVSFASDAISTVIRRRRAQRHGVVVCPRDGFADSCSEQVLFIAYKVDHITPPIESRATGSRQITEAEATPKGPGRANRLVSMSACLVTMMALLSRRTKS